MARLRIIHTATLIVAGGCWLIATRFAYRAGERGALARGLSHPAVSTVIPGMRSPAQVDENTAVGDESALSADTLQALRPHRWVRPAY